MILAIAASMAIANPLPPHPADLAGTYVTSQMEMAGALELGADGRFRYQLEYGAVSETAEGDWRIDGQAVELTSNPMPTPPDFALVRDESAPSGELYVRLENGGFSWSPLEILVSFEGESRPVLLQAEADGSVALSPGKRATSVRMMLPVYAVAGTPVELSADNGHRLLFRLQPNDLGKALFRREPLIIDGSSIIMTRYDTHVVFRRAGQ